MDRSEIKFLKITRTWCSNEMILFNPCTCQFVKKKALLSANFRTTSIKFHVFSPRQQQMVFIIFRNIGWSFTNEISLHFLSSKQFFSKHRSFTKISSQFLSFINFLLKFCNQQHVSHYVSLDFCSLYLSAKILTRN